MNRLVIFFFSLTVFKVSGQVPSFAGVYVTHGNFNARLEIFPDSSYSYKESKRGTKVKDSGRVVYKQDQFFLKSVSMGPKLNKSKSNKTFISVPASSFGIIKIHILPDKIIIPPCDSIKPESCTYYRQVPTKKS